jgi:hypothetical protein
MRPMARYAVDEAEHNPRFAVLGHECVSLWGCEEGPTYCTGAGRMSSLQKVLVVTLRVTVNRSRSKPWASDCVPWRV